MGDEEEHQLITTGLIDRLIQHDTNAGETRLRSLLPSTARHVVMIAKVPIWIIIIIAAVINN